MLEFLSELCQPESLNEDETTRQTDPKEHIHCKSDSYTALNEYRNKLADAMSKWSQLELMIAENSKFSHQSDRCNEHHPPTISVNVLIALMFGDPDSQGMSRFRSSLSLASPSSSPSSKAVKQNGMGMPIPSVEQRARAESGSQTLTHVGSMCKPASSSSRKSAASSPQGHMAFTSKDELRGPGVVAHVKVPLQLNRFTQMLTHSICVISAW